MPALIPAGLGLFELGKSLASGVQAKNLEEKTKSEFRQLKPNASILDYYNKAYNQYNANPYQSQFYNQQMKNVNRSAATALNAAQQRRGGLAISNPINNAGNE